MFQTFTGNSRRPRNVNLSGRNTNPFAQPGGGNLLSGSQNAVAAAQQNRIARQQERDRAHAASIVQRSWRKHAGIKEFRTSQRSKWDEVEATSRMAQEGDVIMTGSQALETPDLAPYPSESQAYSQTELLLRFLDPQDPGDAERLCRYLGRIRLTVQEKRLACVSGPWPAAYLRLQRICLKALTRHSMQRLQDSLLEVIRFILQQLPQGTTWDYSKYYDTLGIIIASGHSLDLGLITAPLEAAPKLDVVSIYQAFSHGLLECAELRTAIGGESGLAKLARLLDCKILGRAVAQLLHGMNRNDPWYISASNFPRRLWLLTHTIYIYKYTKPSGRVEDYASDHDFVFIAGTLLSSLVDDLVLDSSLPDLDEDSVISRRTRSAPVDPFVREQIQSLVNRASVTGLLTLIESKSPSTSSALSPDTIAWGETRLLANYILTLIRLFPGRGDDIRVWLYLGSKGSSTNTVSSNNRPVIRYFWEATCKTTIYSLISRDSREAIALLKPRTPVLDAEQQKSGRPDTGERQLQVDDEWRIILIFIELYMFVLRIMDDEQFFSSGRPAQLHSTVVEQTNPLSLTEIQALTLFLKNLGFTMYYNASDILGSAGLDDEDGLAKLFQISHNEAVKDTSQQKSATKVNATHIAGVHGMTVDHVKGLVTGLMRAIYERDSRRPFLPKDHWLMTSRFMMDSFIDSVVAEEERRNEVQSDDEEDGSDAEDDQLRSGTNLIGTGHTQQAMRRERLQQQRRRQYKKQYLQKVAPRQEILSNLPFFIPFTTRVEIFRRFVYLDQMKRRGGLDADAFGMIHHPGGHQAKIRREHEFEDAYDQFYKLGASLKEPIRITFVDKFDTVEAGIDGGGVTKEFLTTVTNQAFAPSDSIDMFVANDQQLLYPNPSALEEQKEVLRDAGFKEGSTTWNAAMTDLLHRYEFLGRIIGKCLYEGILIDVGFAGFFLLKWALTGGPGSAPKESGYRANINDLRDFDEGLYQGLIQLKNYSGNVEDFALNFTVTDVISSSKTSSTPGQNSRVKTITRDLREDGSKIAVTNANRLVYISKIAHHRLQMQPKHQTDAFLSGLASIIQPSWLSMFNQTELQTLVGGAASSISVPDLRANTVYGGVYAIGDDGLEHPSVQLFWQVMEEFSQEDRRKVLKFVTSTPRAPLLGFGNLNPKFSIRDAGRDETRLPSTSTCVNLLKLPMYSKKHLLKTKLLQAVNAGAGFDLS